MTIEPMLTNAEIRDYADGVRKRLGVDLVGAAVQMHRYAESIGRELGLGAKGVSGVRAWAIDVMERWPVTIIGPATPGAQPGVMARCLSLTDARAKAESLVADRRDLSMYDVRIVWTRSGKTIDAAAGPCR